MDDVKSTVTAPSALRQSLGRYGIRSIALRLTNPARRPELADAVRELEDIGYRTVWLGASPSMRHARMVLEESARLVVATSIQTIWEQDPADAAKEFAALEAAHPGRFLLGLGVAHAATTGRYLRPYSAMAHYLDALDAGGQPPQRRLLASLGPKMLELARDRSAGSIPYLATAQHTAQAREVLGDGPLLAPEVKVLLETDPDRARTLARLSLSTYLTIPNYANNLLRLGFTEGDLAGGGSDQLIDALVAWGDEERVKRRLDEFFAAGADHVAIQVIHENPLSVRFVLDGQPLEPRLREGWRRLGAALLGS
ncbi:LLM class F420-dependent oxidoreductase [Streptomyces sp. NPDC048277]|uniref:LLM class F420-dependent oxidoreductase n=1 Tax=Streptomyces sp. NPDC048277 TaxID=3155027 RepID=UPI0033E42CEB